MLEESLKGRLIYVVRYLTERTSNRYEDDFQTRPSHFDQLLVQSGATVVNPFSGDGVHTDLGMRKDLFRKAAVVILSPQEPVNQDYLAEGEFDSSEGCRHRKMVTKSSLSWQISELGREDAWMALVSPRQLLVFESMKMNPDDGLLLQPIDRSVLRGFLHQLTERRQKVRLLHDSERPDTVFAAGAAIGERGLEDYRKTMSGAGAAHSRPSIGNEIDPANLPSPELQKRFGWNASEVARSKK
jgi:hypothetical protein